MAKGFSYKGVNFEGKGYNKHYHRLIVEHNIPESYIVNIAAIPYNVVEIERMWTYNYAYIKPEEFAQFEDKIIWPTEISFGGFDRNNYLGCLLIKAYDGVDVLTYCEKYTHKHCGDIILLFPLDDLRDYSQSSWRHPRNASALPNRNVKILMSKDEYNKDKVNKRTKSDDLRKKNNEIAEAIKKKNPCFGMSTPKLKVLGVLKKTDWLDLKVGDIIYGYMAVMKRDERGNYKGCLNGYMYSNEVKVFVNDELARCLSPLTFQELLQQNFYVELV